MSLTLYVGKNCFKSHMTRMVAVEKDLDVDFIEVDPENPLVLEMNPYGELPVLKTREMVLYGADTIMHFLDERYPVPALMPAYPVPRAKIRLGMLRIEKDWYALVDKIMLGTKTEKTKAKEDLEDSLIAVSPIFSESEFFMSDEITLADCSLAALFWRLPSLGIKIPKKAEAISAYALRMFKRPMFKESLTLAEQALSKLPA